MILNDFLGLDTPCLRLGWGKQVSARERRWQLATASLRGHSSPAASQGAKTKIGGQPLPTQCSPTSSPVPPGEFGKAAAPLSPRCSGGFAEHPTDLGLRFHIWSHVKGVGAGGILGRGLWLQPPGPGDPPSGVGTCWCSPAAPWLSPGLGGEGGFERWWRGRILVKP